MNKKEFLLIKVASWNWTLTPAWRHHSALVLLCNSLLLAMDLQNISGSSTVVELIDVLSDDRDVASLFA